MRSLIIASRNAHKVQEIRSILGNGFTVLDLNSFPAAPKVVEDAPTFAGNATKKAVKLAEWLALRSPAPDCWVLADDSGLEVDALNGAPGVHSARFAALDSGAEGNSADRENNRKLLRLLSSVPEDSRTARFRCVLALTPVNGARTECSSPVCSAEEGELMTELFEGTCEGTIAFEASGAGGFGYDPLFVPIGFHKSFAELGEETKNGISHRARALDKLRKHFESRH